MATSTARDIIKKALLKAGVLAEGEDPSSSEANDTFDALNLMLESWAGRSLLTTAQIQETLTLTAGTSSYTIGSGGDIDTTKPFSIESAFIRDSNNTDYGVAIVGRTVYDSYSDKAYTTNTARPRVLFYDPGTTQQSTQLGTIYLYPIPDSSSTYTLYINSEKPFTSFTNLSDTVTFPIGYKRAMIYWLAIEVAPDFGRPISIDLQKTANESLRIIENINSRNKRRVAVIDVPGGVGGGYDVSTDE